MALTITNIITLVVTCIVYVSLLPMWLPFINAAVTDLEGYMLAQVMIAAMPLFVIIALIQTLFTMSEARYEGGY